MALVWTGVIVLVLITTVFAVQRVVTDYPNVRDGIIPPADSIDHGYARHPAIAYTHIVPGVIYMVLAPLQFLPGLRRRRPRLHRVLGRTLVAAGIVTGLFAIALGVIVPFGGPTESAATLTFGAIFLFSLALGFVRARQRRFAAHREWMIRAFAIGLGVSTIRLWVPVLMLSTEMTFQEFFGIAFWLAFVMHFVAAETWINITRPQPNRSTISSSGRYSETAPRR